MLHICKELDGLATLDRAVLRRRVVEASKRYASARCPTHDEDIADALTSAMSRGWVQLDSDTVTLTEAGAAQARRSRVGGHRRRVI